MSCLDVEVVFPLTFWIVDPLGASLAAVFGLLVGVVIAILLARCFLLELAKDRIQQSDKRDWTNNEMYERRLSYDNSDEVPLTGYHSENEDTALTDDTTRRGGSGDSKEFHSQVTIQSYDADRRDRDQKHWCLIEALNKTSQAKVQTELSLQDIKETGVLEDELREQKQSAFLHLLRIILGKFVAKQRIDEEYVDEFLEAYIQSVGEVVQMGSSEQAAKEDELRQKPDLMKDPLSLEEATERSQHATSHKTELAVQDLQLKLRGDLSKDTDLTEEEIDALFEKLTANMVEVERMVGQEATRQAAVLQERLEHRRALAQQYAGVNTRENKGNQTRQAGIRSIIEGLVEERRLMADQGDSIIKQYEEDVTQMDENHLAGVKIQSQQLSEKLLILREKKLKKLKKQQDEELQELTLAASKAGNISDFVQAHHSVLQQHRDKRNSLTEGLDRREAEDIFSLRQQLGESRDAATEEREESLFEIVAERGRLADKEANKMIRRHLANVKNYQDKQDAQREEQQADIQSRLVERRALWEEDQQRQEAEKKQLAEQQAKTVSRLLDTQTGLDEEARRQIMLQHDRNVLMINNQLQMARMKSQKILQAKLAQQGAKIELLKEKQREELEAATTEKQAINLKDQHAQEVALEMKAIDRAKMELRSRLAMETKEALKAKDAQLEALIGKLQVGQARRQDIIKRQDKALKELQDQLVDSVSTNHDVSERQTSQIIKNHMREIDQVEEKLRAAREHQAKVLQEKYEAKKLLKEKSFASRLEEEKREISKTQTATAVCLMNTLLLETRHKQAMKKLEQEMKLELAQQKVELNEQLQQAMLKELEEQEMNFLGHLAVVSDMSKDDLKDMVKTAVADGGGNSSDAKRISKNMVHRVNSVRAQGGLLEEEEEEAIRRTKKKDKRKR